MSSIHFNTHEESVQLAGSERAYFRRLIDKITLSVLSMSHFDSKLDSRKIPPFSLSLNTAVLSGSEQINLMARLHGQCEIHAYFLPEDFGFFVEVMKAGLEDKIFRQNQGWEDVIDLFQRSKTPIVTSFSGTESFPNPGLCNMEQEDFDGLTQKEAFDLSFGALSNKEDLRIARSRQLFDNGASAFNFINK